MDEPVGLVEPPPGIGAIPHPIEPNAADRTVVREEFAQLAIHVVDVSTEIASFGPARFPPRHPARIIVRVMPIELGVVKEDLDAFLASGVDQHAKGITP